MISCHVDFPWVLDQKSEFKCNWPLSCMNSAFTFVSERYDASTRLRFYIVVNPLVSAKLIKPVLKRTVSCHGGGIGEYYLSHVEGHMMVVVNIFRDFFCSRTQRSPVWAFEGAELAVGDVYSRMGFFRQVFYALHSLQGCQVVSRLPKIVCMHVNCVRHVKKLVYSAQSAKDFSWSYVEVSYRVVEVFDVSAIAPGFQAARINDFYGVSLCSRHHPSHVGSALFY